MNGVQLDMQVPNKLIVVFQFVKMEVDCCIICWCDGFETLSELCSDMFVFYWQTPSILILFLHWIIVVLPPSLPQLIIVTVVVPETNTDAVELTVARVKIRATLTKSNVNHRRLIVISCSCQSYYGGVLR